MFEDKVAVITGSARGIGRAAAEILVGGGAKVVIADLDRAVAQQTADELGADKTAVWAGNLANPDAPDELVAACIEAFGQLDILVNNAGYTLDAPVHKMSDDDFQAMLDIHTIVPFRMIRAAAPHMREVAKQEKEQGIVNHRKIVNVASIAAYGNAGQTNYSSAKAGTIALAKTVAREWGPFNVNVNAVAFGVIETRLTQTKTSDSVADIDGRKVQVGVPEQTMAMISAMIPMGRPGTPTEAAGGIAFLCSPWSDYVSGQVINVTGGVGFGMQS